jgi:arginase
LRLKSAQPKKQGVKLAVKIIRQPKKIVLIGAGSSAAAHEAGCEQAPAALRPALAAQFEHIGFEVSDGGEIPVNAWKADDDSPRARNARATVASVEALQLLAERAVKSGGLPVIVGGDCTVTLAALAAVRRYYKEVSLIWCDSDADLNTPATTPSGCLEGMVVAHVAGQGAPELVRFFKEPPLVREPDIALFGVNRLDPGEEKWLAGSPMRRYTPEDIRELGPRAAAEAALERIHTFNRQWVLHLDVDVLSDVTATFWPAEGGLRSEEFAEALEVFLRHPGLSGVVITEFVPSKDADGAAARMVVDLVAGAMRARYAALVEAKEVKDEKEVEEVKEEAAAAVSASVGTTEAEPAASSEGASGSSADEPSEEAAAKLEVATDVEKDAPDSAEAVEKSESETAGGS